MYTRIIKNNIYAPTMKLKRTLLTKKDETESFLSPIKLNSNDILKLYNINSVEKLYEWFKENINKYSNHFTINRVLNCWIKNNYDILKNHHDILNKIYGELILRFPPQGLAKSEIFQDIYYENEKDIYMDTYLNKYLDNYNFINKWFNKHNGNEFDLNLYDDYINFLMKNVK
jgi:hypothetical protein